MIAPLVGRVGGYLMAGLCVTLMWCTAGVTHGQSGRQSTAGTEAEVGAEDDEAVMRVQTQEVVLPVSVRNAAGQPVFGLGAENFLIYDDGTRQEIISFNRRRVPANIVLLLDASGSVFSHMRFIREAAKNFVSSLGAEDRVCVMQFADRVNLLQDWINAREVTSLSRTMDWRYHPGAKTALYDGLYLAAEEQLRKVEGRRIIILLTDGLDTAERRHASLVNALDAVRRVEASVYVVSLTSSLRAVLEAQSGGRLARLLAGGYNRQLVAQYLSTINNAEKQMEQIVELTGGRMFLPLDNEDLLPAYTAIAEELRTQYIISFKPKTRALAGEWRALHVLVTPGGYDVATRTGYTGQSSRGTTNLNQ